MNHLLGVIAAHPEIAAGAAVLALSPLLIAKAARRAGKRAEELATLTEEQLAERGKQRERRGQRVEDVLTLGVGAAAAYLSSTGLRKFGANVMGLSSPWFWLPFVALDMAAVVCGRRARRRARNGLGPGVSGMLMWALIGISSTFSASEAADFKGSVARAAWPLISGLLFELGSIEERLAAKQEIKKRAGLWLDRKIAAVRMLHPIEWVRVQLALASDESLSQTDATRMVRINRAGLRLYQLRQVTEAGKKGLRRRWRDRQAQAASSRVQIDDLDQVMTALQLRVRTRDFANLQFGTPAPGEKFLANLIGTRRLSRTVLSPSTSTGTGTGESGTGTGVSTGTGTAHAEMYRAGGTGTPTGTGTPSDGTGTGVVPVPRDQHPPAPGTGTGARTGTGTGKADAGTGTGTGPARYPVPPQVNAGTAAPSGTPQDGSSPETARTRYTDQPQPSTAGTSAPRAGTGAQNSPDKTDEELVAAMLADLGEDGKFGTGGIRKTATHYGIGTDRARRLMEEAVKEKARPLMDLARSPLVDIAPAEQDSPVSVSSFDIEAALAQARPVAELLNGTYAAPGDRHERAVDEVSAPRDMAVATAG